MSNEPIEGVGFNEFIEAVIRLSREPNALHEVSASLGLAGPERWSAVERAWRARIEGDPMLKQVYEMFTEQAGVGSAPSTTSSPGPSPSEPSTAMVALGPPPPAPQAVQPAPLFVPSYMLNAQAPAPPPSPAPSPAPPPSSPVAPPHAVAFEASRAVEAKFTMPASSLAAPVSLPFRDKPGAPPSGIQSRHASPAPIPAEQSGFTAAPNSKALNTPALPFPGRAPDVEEIPLERYAEITSLLLREGNPEATFARMGVDAARWMKCAASAGT
jgi:hypothetical protein